MSAMKKTILVAICLLCSTVLQAQDIEGFVSRQMESYPKSRLIDIYKSCLNAKSFHTYKMRTD